MMPLIPAFEMGLWNAWLFMIIFPLQWLVVLFVPKHFAERTSHPADPKQDRRGKVMGRLAEWTWVGATLYSIFLPLEIGTIGFYVGLGAFMIGVMLLLSATLTVAQTAVGEPFTGGIYRFSRHPMYLAMIFAYVGISISAASWLFMLITVATFFLQRFQMIREEVYCCEKFGHAYREYMNRTPRWIGLPNHGDHS